MHGQNCVLAIILTKRGKSLFFILFVFCGIEKITIVSNNRKPRLESILIYDRQVIVLLIALQHDLRRRCQKAGINYYEWNRRRPPDSARIIMVTPESARSDDFIRFINRIRG